LQELADAIIEAVGGVSVDGRRGDSAGKVMHGAYLRAFRRFRAIARLAQEGAGDEVFILTRSLVSLVARAAYVDAPTDSSERRERWKRLVKADLTEKVATLEGMRDLGSEVDDDELRVIRESLDELADVKNLPPDRQLLEGLRLSAFYFRVYRPGSDFAHFTWGVAVAEIEDVEAVALDAVNDQLVKEGLAFAILTYGQFLQLSDRTVQHGLTQRVTALVESFDDWP
jgi:hypothetical protein